MPNRKSATRGSGKTKLKAGDIVAAMGATGLFQIIGVREPKFGRPAFYDCVQVHRYAEEALALESAEEQPTKRKPSKREPTATKFKVGDVVEHRNTLGMLFQIVEVLLSVPPGGPSLYGCVQLRRYAEKDLTLEDEEEQTS